MKKSSVLFLLAMLLISITIVNTKCKSKSTPEGYSSKPPNKRTIFDTVKLIGVFVSPDRNQISHDTMWRVTFDSVETMVETGNGTFKKLWKQKDTLYWLPQPIALIDTATKKPILDSLGMQKIITQSVGPYTKEVVWDTGISVDSAIKRFAPFLKQDSVKKK